jgi:hypothetical protein
VLLSPGDGVWQLLYGQALARSLDKVSLQIGAPDPDTRAKLDASRAALKRRLELLGDVPEAWAGIGQTYLHEPKGSLAPGIAALERAFAHLPDRPDIALQLATLLDIEGARGRRNLVLSKGLGPVAADRIAARMNSNAAFREALEKVDRLCREKKPEEAQPILESLVARASPEYRPALAEQLAAVKAASAHSRAVKRYNEAIARLNAQDLERARAEFRALAAQTEDAKIAADARREAEKITRFLAERNARSSFGH